MDNQKPKDPVIFLKPDTSLIQKNQPFFKPAFSEKIHHELELVIKINRVGKFIDKKFAHKYYSQIGLGIDFTARDIQNHCKENGLPWEKAKGFDGSAQISHVFINKNDIENKNILFHLSKNGTTVQTGNSSDMIFSFDKIIEHISKFYTLKIGDLIFTGTPEGVGNVKAGDQLVGFIHNKEMLKVNVK